MKKKGDKLQTIDSHQLELMLHFFLHVYRAVWVSVVGLHLLFSPVGGRNDVFLLGYVFSSHDHLFCFIAA